MSSPSPAGAAAALTVATPSAQKALDVVERMLPMLRHDSRELTLFDDYMRGKHARPYKPADATDEYRLLEARSVANVMPLVVGTIAQTLYLEGYRRGDQADNAPAWRAWQANGLDGRQSMLYRSSLTYGVAYMVVLPGTTAPVMRPVSPRRLLAVYDDQAADEWPRFALESVPYLNERGERCERFRLYDDEQVHDVAERDVVALDSLRHDGAKTHGLGVCPVVRYPCELDLEGRYTGVVGPLIPSQDRLNQTTFDMNMVQSYGSFVIRTASGMTLPGMPGTEGGGESGDAAKAREAKMRVGADRFLVSQDPDTKFGTLAGTPLDGYIGTRDQAQRDIATKAQVPPHHLLGGNAAMSAEALAATETGLQRQSDSHQHTFGESHEQSFRLSALADGDRAGWEDYEAQSVWANKEARSFAQTADALLKLHDGLEVDAEMLWPMIPGWTQLDVERAKELRERRRREDPLGELEREFDRQGSTTGGIPGNDPASRAAGEASAA